MDIQTSKKRRVRSPAYPMIPLDDAIDKVKILWENEKNNPFPKEAAIKDLGYDSYGGYSARVISALKQFGLISEEQNNIVLTKWAVDLCVYEPINNNYKNILKEIALNPITYRKLHDEYNGGLPSDSTLKLKLLREYGFNAGKIDGFLKDFRRTLTIAGLSDKEEVTDMKHNNNYQKEYHEKTQEITPETQNKILQIVIIIV